MMIFLFSTSLMSMNDMSSNSAQIHTVRGATKNANARRKQLLIANLSPIRK